MKAKMRHKRKLTFLFLFLLLSSSFVVSGNGKLTMDTVDPLGDATKEAGLLWGKRPKWSDAADAAFLSAVLQSNHEVPAREVARQVFEAASAAGASPSEAVIVASAAAKATVLERGGSAGVAEYAFNAVAIALSSKDGSGGAAAREIAESAITTASIVSDSVLKEVDIDADGKIESEEVRAFVKKLGGSNFDDAKEIQEGMRRMMENLEDDKDKDSEISKADITGFLRNLDAHLTVEHVSEWVAHAVQLPQYSETFRKHGVNGLDFPLLMQDDGRMLLEELDITSKLHRTKIVRAMKVRALGIADVPLKPSNLTCESMRCGEILLRWETPLKIHQYGLPVHLYRIQVDSDNDPDRISWQPVPNSNVYPKTLKTLKFLVRNLAADVSYNFRVRAWNGVGCSEWIDVEHCKTIVSKECEKEKAKKCAKDAQALTNWFGWNGNDYDSLSDGVCAEDDTTMDENMKSRRQLNYNLNDNGGRNNRNSYKNDKDDSKNTGGVYGSIVWLFASFNFVFSVMQIGVMILSVFVGSRFFYYYYTIRNRNSAKLILDPTIPQSPKVVASACNTCNATFGFWNRKRIHYCNMCHDVFCGQHGKVVCKLSCSIGGGCICQQCLGRIAVGKARDRWKLVAQKFRIQRKKENGDGKKPKPNNLLSSLGLKLNLSQKNFQSVKRSESPEKQTVVQSGGEDNDTVNISRMDSIDDCSTEVLKTSSAKKRFWSFKSRRRMYKRKWNPDALLPVVHLRETTLEIAKCFALQDKETSALERLMTGVSLYKKVGCETKYQTRFLWAAPNENESDNTSIGNWNLHWSKGEVKDLCNKTMPVGDIVQVFLGDEYHWADTPLMKDGKRNISKGFKRDNGTNNYIPDSDSCLSLLLQDENMKGEGEMISFDLVFSSTALRDDWYLSFTLLLKLQRAALGRSDETTHANTIDAHLHEKSDAKREEIMDVYIPLSPKAAEILESPSSSGSRKKFNFNFEEKETKSDEIRKRPDLKIELNENNSNSNLNCDTSKIGGETKRNEKGLTNFGEKVTDVVKVASSAIFTVTSAIGVSAQEEKK